MSGNGGSSSMPMISYEPCGAQLGHCLFLGPLLFSTLSQLIYIFYNLYGFLLRTEPSWR